MKTMMLTVMTGLCLSVSTATLAQGLRERAQQVMEQNRRDTESRIARAQPITPKGRILQKLLYSTLSVDFKDTPARDAFNFIKTALDVNLIVRYNTDALGFGIDPETPITLEIENGDARDVLEMVIEQCALIDECTWQLRSSFLEVGTKDRLAMPGAQETVVVPVGDLLYSPPDFDGAPSLDLEYALSHGYSPYLPGVYRGSRGIGTPYYSGGGYGAGYGRRLGNNFYRSGSIFRDNDSRETRRESHQQAAAELIELIVAIVDPNQWEQNGGLGASIAFHNDSLVIKAPDFMLRQIVGYAKVPPPVAHKEASDGPQKDSGGTGRSD